MGVVNSESCSADLNLRRFPLSEIPMESEEEISEWLVKLFQEKVNSLHCIHIVALSPPLNMCASLGDPPSTMEEISVTFKARGILMMPLWGAGVNYTQS